MPACLPRCFGQPYRRQVAWANQYSPDGLPEGCVEPAEQLAQPGDVLERPGLEQLAVRPAPRFADGAEATGPLLAEDQQERPPVRRVRRARYEAEVLEQPHLAADRRLPHPEVRSEV